VAWWRGHHARGEVIIVRWADDFVAGFRDEQDTRRFLAELGTRFAKFGLELYPDKTRLIEFGRFATERRRKRGAGKPETFDFLGFTHICAMNRAVLDQAHHDHQADASEAGADQDRAEATLASTHLGAGAVAGQRATRSLRLLRRARQLRRDQRVPVPGHRALAKTASPSQLACPAELGPDDADHESMATTTPRETSLLGSTLRRRYPRQDPSAVIPHAGIDAGAARKGGPYRDLPGRPIRRCGFAFRKLSVVVFMLAMLLLPHNGVCHVLRFVVRLSGEDSGSGVLPAPARNGWFFVGGAGDAGYRPACAAGASDPPAGSRQDPALGSGRARFPRGSGTAGPGALRCERASDPHTERDCGT